MSKHQTMSINDVDVGFENTLMRVVMLNALQEVKIGDLSVGPIGVGEELETRYWVASQLVTSGFARFQEDALMSYDVLHGIHWKETKLQRGRTISSLPRYFYPKLRRYLSQLKLKATKDATRSNEYNNAVRLTQDIISCRLKKIVGLSASQTQTEETLQKLSLEERNLYDRLYDIVSGWRSKILKTSTSSRRSKTEQALR